MEIAAKQRDIIAKRWFCNFNIRGESEHMRLDKYLKVSRLIKRRQSIVECKSRRYY